MKHDFLRAAGFVLAMFMFTAVNVLAQDPKPVKIAFDEKLECIDLVTGKAVPRFTSAERGSVQFFLGRLDRPDRFFNFYHDGFQTAKIENVKCMKKTQEQFAIWRIYFNSGSKNTPRVQHQAVSFIPIGPDGKPGERVCVLLKCLTLIDWSE